MSHREERKRIIEDLKRYGLEREINNTLRRLGPVPSDLAYLEGEDLNAYNFAAHVCQDFAYENRWNIAITILRGLELRFEDFFNTSHNYFNIHSGIIRKGAVRAEKDERLIIPLNMRDGSLICRGKGNEDWLCSAPKSAEEIESLIGDTVEVVKRIKPIYNFKAKG